MVGCMLLASRKIENILHSFFLFRYHIFQDKTYDNRKIDTDKIISYFTFDVCYNACMHCICMSLYIQIFDMAVSMR